jgi:hypothetical protein
MRAEIRRPTAKSGAPQTQHTTTSLASAPANTVHLGEEPGRRYIHLQINPSLLRYDGTVYIVSMTPAEARETARTLLDQAAAVDADMEFLAMEAAGICTVGAGGGGVL